MAYQEIIFDPPELMQLALTKVNENYTTTDAPINAQLKVDIVWQDIDNGTVTAV